MLFICTVLLAPLCSILTHPSLIPCHLAAFTVIEILKFQFSSYVIHLLVGLVWESTKTCFSYALFYLSQTNKYSFLLCLFYYIVVSTLNQHFIIFFFYCNDEKLCSMMELDMSLSHLRRENIIYINYLFVRNQSMKTFIIGGCIMSRQLHVPQYHTLMQEYLTVRNTRRLKTKKSKIINTGELQCLIRKTHSLQTTTKSIFRLLLNWRRLSGFTLFVGMTVEYTLCPFDHSAALSVIFQLWCLSFVGLISFINNREPSLS